MLWIAQPHRAAFAKLNLNSAPAVARHFFDEALPAKGGVQVLQKSFQTDSGQIPVFCKQYFFQSPAWQFVGRASKARCEFLNYEVFSRLGIACAEPIVCGEERDALGRLCRAFIVTRAIPNAQTLVDFFRKVSVSRSTRAELVRQIAGMTRRIHEANFFHHDLVWRNILVTLEPAPKLWWIDCPRGQFDRWSPWQNRRRLKDLASLDKLASQFCTPRERIRFVQIYLGKTKLDRAAKELIRAELSYRKKRWPEDWIDRKT